MSVAGVHIHHTAGHCFPSVPVSPAIAPHLSAIASKTAGYADALLNALPDKAVEPLASFFSLLLCGEESAIHVFDGAARHPGDAKAQDALQSIAFDEMTHERILSTICSRFRLDESAVERRARKKRRSRHFYVKINSNELPIHLARVAALDAIATRIIAGVQTKTSLFCESHRLMDVLTRIRSDESRHVRITRDYVLDNVADGAALLEREREFISAEFAPVFEAELDYFEQIGIDPDRLRSNVFRGRAPIPA